MGFNYFLDQEKKRSSQNSLFFLKTETESVCNSLCKCFILRGNYMRRDCWGGGERNVRVEWDWWRTEVSAWGRETLRDNQKVLWENMDAHLYTKGRKTRGQRGEARWKEEEWKLEGWEGEKTAGREEKEETRRREMDEIRGEGVRREDSRRSRRRERLDWVKSRTEGKRRRTVWDTSVTNVGEITRRPPATAQLGDQLIQRRFY